MKEHTIDGPRGLDRVARITPAVTGLFFLLQLAACDGESHGVDAGYGEDAGEPRDAAGEVDAAAPECMSADACPPASSPCAIAVCEDGSCGFAPAEAGTECRASTGTCDLAEACDGTSLECPEDAFVAAGTECRASAGACDVAETCDGASAACPADAFALAGIECRAPADACDLAEVCDGTRAECPEDALVAAGTECRASAGACDLAETCDGASAACPADAFAAAGTECRAPAGVCDEAEVCTGSASCPDDSGLAVLCQPMTPVEVTALGRDLTFTTVDLNGTGASVASVGPGLTVTLRVAGGWVDTNADCGGCATQFYVGMDGVFTRCLGSTTADLTFDESISFTAPATPGVYIINTSASWEFMCQPTRAFSTDFSAGSVATLIVE